MTEYMCKSCGRSFPRFNPLQTKCGLCAYNKYAKPRKPMKKLGKVSKQWISDRNQWIKNNPPDDGEHWTCYLQITPTCPILITADQLTLDHVKSRGRHPELRRDQDNFKPACYPCNEKKGSKDLSEVKGVKNGS